MEDVLVFFANVPCVGLVIESTLKKFPTQLFERVNFTLVPTILLFGCDPWL
jgi:hypothetical protein